jgi:TPR repeat protein
VGHLVMSLGARMAADSENVVAESKVTRSIPDTPRAETQVTAADDSPAGQGEAEVVPASTERATTAEAPQAALLKRASAPQQVQGEDVPSLWAAVENGDTRAEVALAMRYVVGNGVPQSCTQARVLLEAAAKRGSAEARQELNELPQAGCR